MEGVFAASVRALARGARICCLVALVLIVGTAATAHAAAVGLPAGWSLDGGDLVWTSAAPLRMGAARYEFRSRDQLLGYPAQRGDVAAAADPRSRFAGRAFGVGQRPAHRCRATAAAHR